MKIAFLDSWLQSSAEGSGTAVGIQGLEKSLRELGHEVTRVSPKGTSRFLMLRRLVFNLRLAFFFDPKRFDAVVGFDIDGFLCWRARKNGNYFVSVKGVLAEEATHEKGRWFWILWGLSRLEKFNARRARRVLTTSRYCGEAIARHYGISPSKIQLVPEGIDCLRWKQVPRAEHRLRTSTILCVARQYPRKHVRDLVRAMKEVAQRFANAKAVVVGDGPDHASLRQLVKELGLGGHVELKGAIASDAEVALLYGQASIFCLPSVQEGFGIVFLEAMAMGLPIVATRAAAIGEVVAHERGGILVEPGNVDQLVSAIEALLADPGLRERFSQYNQQRVESYDWLKVANEFINAIS